MNAPSNKFFSTVEIELFTIFVRSKNGSTTTPSGFSEFAQYVL
jgi:hypothetical protein